jgi:hypothetical protein
VTVRLVRRRIASLFACWVATCAAGASVPPSLRGFAEIPRTVHQTPADIFADTTARRLISRASALPRSQPDDRLTSRVRIAAHMKRPVLWRDRTMYRREAIVTDPGTPDSDVAEIRRGSPTLGDAFVTRSGFLGFDPESDENLLFGVMDLDRPGMAPMDPLRMGEAGWPLLGTVFPDPLSVDGIPHYRYRTIADSWEGPDGVPLTEIRVESEQDARGLEGSIWFERATGAPVRAVFRTTRNRSLEAGLRGRLDRFDWLPLHARGRIHVLAIDYRLDAGELEASRVRMRASMYWFYKGLTMPFSADWDREPGLTTLPAPLGESWDYRVPDRDLLPFLREEARNADRPPFEGWGSVLRATGASVRFNPVEGVSIQPRLTIPAGARSEVELRVRAGSTSFHPTASLTFSQTLAPTIWGLEGYSRLENANRWSRAHSIGRSISALFLGGGRADYYRATGAAAWADFRTRPFGLEVRAFGERHEPALPRTYFAVIGSADTVPPPLVADRGDLFGLKVTAQLQLGADPQRGLLVLRGWGELAGGDFDFWDIGGIVDGIVPLPLRLSGAARLGIARVGDDAPVQRRYFLGGHRSLRGFSSGTRLGQSLLMGRFEVANDLPALRLVAFTDVGWAADRELLDSGRLQSVGVGVSLMDSLMRIDLAWPISGGRGWKVHFSTEGLF